MANYRQLHTRTWSDSWFLNLSNEQKLLFIYLFSNQRASVTGLYEMPIKLISLETGLDRTVIHRAFEVYTAADKVHYDSDTEVVWVVNMPKYQLGERINVTLQKRIEADIKAVPDCELKIRFLKQERWRQMGHACPIDGVNSISTQSQSQSQSPEEERVQGEEKPRNIFRFYEQNIGAITPVIADGLRDAEQSDGEEWVCAAIEEAVKSNARSWKYCEAILSRWRRDGFRVDTKPKANLSSSSGQYSPDQIQEWVESHSEEES